MCSSKVGYDESLERTAMTASSAGEEGCSLVPEGPTRPAMALALEVVEGLEDEVWWVGLLRFRS